MAHAAAIGIVGGGRVARSLGAALTGWGYTIEWIASREPAAAARTLLIAVSDDALSAVAASLAREYPAGDGIALHTSGAHGPDILAPLAAKGFECGTLHPLQTIAVPAADAFRGVAFAISGSDKAIAFAREIVATLDGTSLRIDPEHRTLYHAAAVMVSNYVAALIHAAERLFQQAGIDESETRRALAPLIRQTVENCLQYGPANALTGPIRRGDVGTLGAHLTALDSVSEPLGHFYRACGVYTVEMAREIGLSAEPASQIEDLLKCKLP